LSPCIDGVEESAEDLVESPIAEEAVKRAVSSS
jgi:hypothetical protein